VIKPLNDPETAPSLVLVFKLTMGFCVVLQITPQAVIATPPSDVILPPQVAEVVVILLAGVVVIVGTIY